MKTHTSEVNEVWGLQDILFQITWLLLVVHIESFEFGSERPELGDPHLVIFPQINKEWMLRILKYVALMN